MTNLSLTGPQSKNRQISLESKGNVFEANLIKCNSDAKFPGYPWDERKIL